MKFQRNTGATRRPRAIAIVATLAVVGLIAGPTAAFAQQISPTQDQYDPSSGQIEKQVGGGNSATPAGDDPSDRVVSGLPFTGLDIGLLGGVAVLLGASGLALRRFAAGGVGR